MREQSMAERVRAGRAAWLRAEPDPAAPSEPNAAAFRRFFAVCLDDPVTQIAGHPALTPLEAAIDGVDDVGAFLLVSGRLAARGIPGIFGVSLFPHEGGRYLPLLRAHGSERPPAERGAGPSEAREAYRARMHAALGSFGGERLEARVDAVMALEDRLLALRYRFGDDQSTLAVAALASREATRTLPLARYVEGWGVPEHAELHVHPAGYVDGLAGALAPAEIGTLRDYLRWTLFDGLIQSLPARYSDDPEWPAASTCTSLLEELVGLELSNAYGRAHVGAAGRARLAEVVRRVRAAHRAVVDDAGWLDPSVRAVIGRGLEALVVRPGFDEQASPPLPAMSDDHLANVLSLRRFSFERMVAPPDRRAAARPWADQGWALFYATAWSDGFVPGVGIGLGMLEPPVFDPTRPLALDIAGLGFIVGHELTHWSDPDDLSWRLSEAGVDEEGARPLLEGAQCLSAAYDGMGLAVEPSAPRLEIDETLADLGGLRAAYRAYRALPPDDAISPGSGLGADQRFFLTAVQFLCDTHDDPSQLDTSRRRIDRALRAFPEFAAAWSCEPSDPMADAPACDHW